VGEGAGGGNYGQRLYFMGEVFGYKGVDYIRT